MSKLELLVDKQVFKHVPSFNKLAIIVFFSLSVLKCQLMEYEDY